MSSAELRRHVDPRTLDRLLRLDLRARLVVEGFLNGQHRSPYHGFAVEFAAHREYAPGDDIRHIDWKVWSKTDRLYIKEYEEETNLKCHIILDASRSMAYGEPWSKYDHGATAAASLAYLLQQQQDAVGLTLFHDRIAKTLPPSSHPNHWKAMVHELEKSPAEKSDVRGPFLQLASQIRERGLIVLISDLFVDGDALTEAIKQFRLRRHEVLVFHVMHEDELTFPFQDNTLFRGMETADEVFAEPRALRKSYLEAVEGFVARVRGVCSAAGVDYVPMNTAQPLDAALAGYLSFRQKARRIATRRPGG
jgi:uncharacterized protein (DUF58 family)